MNTIDDLSYKSIIVFLVLSTTFIVTTLVGEKLSQAKQVLTELQNTQKSITVTITHNKGK